MNKPKIDEALTAIESFISAESACVRFEAPTQSVDDHFIRGTRAGLILLGIKLIRAGITVEDRRTVFGGIATDEDPKAITHKSSPIVFEWIEISDDLNAEPVFGEAKPKFKDYVILFLVVGSVMAFFAWIAL